MGYKLVIVFGELSHFWKELTDIYNGDKNMLELLRDLGRQIKNCSLFLQKSMYICLTELIHLLRSITHAHIFIMSAHTRKRPAKLCKSYQTCLKR